jgi:hypothetical protein
MALVKFRKSIRYHKELKPGGLRIHDQTIPLRLPWLVLDKARFHAFCQRMNVSEYIRKAIMQFNYVNNKRDLTEEERKRLINMGGWPSKKVQMEYKAKGLNYLGVHPMRVNHYQSKNDKLEEEVKEDFKKFVNKDKEPKPVKLG